jgi:hypothetical protein
MLDLYSFPPNEIRGRAVDRLIREGFAGSIATVFDALASEFDVPSCEALVEEIRRSPVSPGVYGIYTELVESVYHGEMEHACRLAGVLSEPGFGTLPVPQIVTLSDDDLGEGQSDRYRRFVDEDPDLGASLPPLSKAAFSEAKSRVEAAFDLLDAAAPEAAGEVRSLAREIVLVGNPVDDEIAFNGASSFHLWGAIFLNTDSYVGRVEIAEALAHESAHALLFGFAGGQTLARNDPDSRYNSPIRSDPRPMDGIVHATFVLARMHYVISRMLGSNLLTMTERELAAQALARNVSRFAEGICVIDQYALLTPAGAAAIRGAQEYMERASEV